MLFLDIKYASLLGSRLRNFKRKSEFLWNYSCNVCGDSSKNKTKARGFIYRMKTGLAVKCHNCGYSASLGTLIKYTDPNLYEEYVFENYKESGVARSSHKDTSIAVPDIIQPPELSDAVLDPIKRIDQLAVDHPAAKYVRQRNIPSKYHHLLYYAPKFKKYTNTIIPNKFEVGSDGNCVNEHPRLIIPYFNSFGKCFAYQGRAFGDEEPKYFTIKIDENQERIYGLDRVNYSKRIYVLEGPLDTLFIPNAIAVSGSSFNTPTIQSLKANATIVYDNEPRAKDLCKLIAKTIDDGFDVCLWPDSVSFKDINEAVMQGYDPKEIVDIINENTYNGVEALLQFAMWRKC